MFIGAITTVSILACVLLLVRASKGRFLSRLPVFYSYIVYVLAGTTVVLLVLFLAPAYHTQVYWFYYLVSLLAEFAIILEASDHIFEPYPALRGLGRLVCGLICGVLLLLYIGPALFIHEPSSKIFLDLLKSTSLTKGAMIVGLLLAARFFRLPVGRSVKGLLLGFSLYVGASIADAQFALTLGRAAYGSIFEYTGPLAWMVGSLVWVGALWNYQPAWTKGPPGRGQKRNLHLQSELDRLNNALVKLIER